MGWSGWHINGAWWTAGEMGFSSLTFQEAGAQGPYLYNEGNGTDTFGLLWELRGSISLVSGVQQRPQKAGCYSLPHARGFTLPKTQWNSKNVNRVILKQIRPHRSDNLCRVTAVSNSECTTMKCKQLILKSPQDDPNLCFPYTTPAIPKGSHSIQNVMNSPWEQATKRKTT